VSDGLKNVPNKPKQANSCRFWKIQMINSRNVVLLWK